MSATDDDASAAPVLVVGGAGFLGSHLVERLLDDGFSVDVVDDLSSGSLANLATARAMGGALKIHTLDARTAEFRSLVGMRRPGVIFHLGLFTPAQAAGDLDGSVVMSALSALEAARTFGVGKVVVAIPAGLLYGEVPARELPVKEARPFSPLGVRGVLANAVVELLAAYRSEHAVEHTVLAMSTVYGPRQRRSDGVVAALVAAATAGEPLPVHGEGRQTRDLMFVDDAVDALARAGHRGGGLVVNVGTGVQTSIRDLATIVDPAAMTTTAARRHGDLTRVALAPARARIHLQWSPWTDVTAGVRATLDAATSDH